MKSVIGHDTAVQYEADVGTDRRLTGDYKRLTNFSSTKMLSGNVTEALEVMHMN